MSTPSLPSSRLRGAVDLSSLATPASGPSGASGPAGGAAAGEGTWVIEQADQQMLQQLVQLSAQVPVIIHLDVPGDATSAQLFTQFADAVDAQAGRVLMASVDVSAQPQLAQAFGVAAGPAVLLLVDGQPAPLANQAMPAEAISGLFGQILQVAQQNGITGQVPPVAPSRASAGQQAPEAAPVPPAHRAAYDALAADDAAGAVQAWTDALNENPADAVAQQGLAAAQLMQRTQDMDSAAVRTAGAEHPDDAAAQIAVADLDVLGGHVEDAFSRLVRFIGTHPGEDRETVRAHLVDLYTVVGGDDPRVVASRRQLAMALF
ncbi:MAG: co-chaperone YbbN [Micrococcus sp.]|nr:co-chaperone YbbN [Micrococcus sp.]